MKLFHNADNITWHILKKNEKMQSIDIVTELRKLEENNPILYKNQLEKIKIYIDELAKNKTVDKFKENLKRCLLHEFQNESRSISENGGKAATKKEKKFTKTLEKINSINDVSFNNKAAETGYHRSHTLCVSGTRFKSKLFSLLICNRSKDNDEIYVDNADNDLFDYMMFRACEGENLDVFDHHPTDLMNGYKSDDDEFDYEKSDEEEPDKKLRSKI